MATCEAASTLVAAEEEGTSTINPLVEDTPQAPKEQDFCVESIHF